MTQSTAISLKGRPTGAASGGSAGVSGDDRRSVAVSAAGVIAHLLFLFSWLVPVLSVLMYFRGRFAQEQANRSQQLDQCKRVATRRKNWVGFLRRCVHGNEQQGTFQKLINIFILRCFPSCYPLGKAVCSEEDEHQRQDF